MKIEKAYKFWNIILVIFLSLFIGYEGKCQNNNFDSNTERMQIIIYGRVSGVMYIGPYGIGPYYNTLIGGPPLGPISLPGIEVFVESLTNNDREVGRVKTDLNGEYKLEVKIKEDGTRLRLKVHDPEGRFKDVRKVICKECKLSNKVKVNVLMRVNKGGSIIPPPIQKHPDSDGDGFPDWIERIKNTNCYKPESYPRVRQKVQKD